MNERPILFSAPMVLALLGGSKTQTRRVIKPQHLKFFNQSAADMLGDWSNRPLPYGQHGDRLWVRETWRGLRRFDSYPPHYIVVGSMVSYAADQAEGDYRTSPVGRMGKLRPSIFMPRWASRVTLEITGVRVERLQDISDKDVAAEGTPGMIAGRYQCSMCNGQGANLTWPTRCPHCNGTGNNHAEKYRALWDSINAKRAPWASNPWVFVLEFRRLHAS